MDTVKGARLDVRHGGKPVGAEVCSIDLSRDPEDTSFTARFGTQDRHVRQEYALPGYPQIHLTSNVKDGERSIGSAYAGDDWHTDLCFIRKPARYTFLHAIEVPTRDGKVLGDTCFASTAHAYDR